MIPAIVKTVNATIATLPWIESLSGLARPVTRPGENPAVFPIGINENPADCFNSGAYKAMLPDSNKASVLFWEKVGPETSELDPRIPKRRGNNHTQILRLVVWANLDRLTLSEGQEGRLRQSIENALYALRRFRMTTPYKTTVYLEVGSHTFGAEAVSQYTYSEKGELFFYPYVCFSIEIKASWLVIGGCATVEINKVDPLCYVYPFSLTEVDTGDIITLWGVTGTRCYISYIWNAGELPKFTDSPLPGILEAYQPYAHVRGILDAFGNVWGIENGVVRGEEIRPRVGDTWEMYWNALDTSKGVWLTVHFIKPL